MRWSTRNIVSWALATLLILFGYVRRAKQRAFRGEYILSVYFHKPSKKEFETCIKWLKKNQFTFLRPDDIKKIIQQDLELPKGAVILTVDDGWETNFKNIVEVANKYAVPVTIFVATEPVETGNYWWSYVEKAKSLNFNLPSKAYLKEVTNKERTLLIDSLRNKFPMQREALTIEQIKLINNSKYCYTGSHTHTHPILTNCNQSEVYEELSISKSKLELWIGEEVYCFAYPNGDYNSREVQALSDLHYQFAFTSKFQYLRKESFKHIYELPRFGFWEGASFAENLCRIVGIWQPLILKFQKPFRKNNIKTHVPKHNITSELKATIKP